MRNLIFLFLINSGCADSLVTSRGAELKVTRAVLYQNGIGYFERRGHIDDDVLHLRVRPDQIRDFLKSLTVVDLHEGRAVSIDFPIEKGRAQQMSDLPEQVRAQGGVLAIASAFRGARCHVSADSSATGRLVGVEDLGGDKQVAPLVRQPDPQGVVVLRLLGRQRVSGHGVAQQLATLVLHLGSLDEP